MKKHSSKKINVCLVSPLPPPYGGISHWTQMVANHASKMDDVNLVVVDIAPKWRSIHNTGLLIRSIGGAIQLIINIFELIKSLISNRIHVLHLTTPGHLAVVRDLVIAYITSIFGLKFIYHIRFGRIPIIAKANSIEWRIIQKVMMKASSVIAIDQTTYSAIQRFTTDVNVILLPNCVNIPSPSTTTQNVSNRKTILFIGWVIPGKGISELIEAWSQMNSKNWTLDIIGPGDTKYQSHLLQKFKPNNVNFLGELTHANAMENMEKCDIFVLPSHSEGFPNVLLEAMVRGRPIIATDVGAIPEMLANNSGAVIKSKDVDALRNKIEQFISDPQLRKNIGETAYIKALDLYTIDKVFNSYTQLWRSS